MELGTIQDREARKRLRMENLQKIVNFGEKARNAREIMDIFLDGVEDLVLSTLTVTSDPEKLLQIKMYYQACRQLDKEFDSMLREAAIKQKTLEELKEKKGE